MKRLFLPILSLYLLTACSLVTGSQPNKGFNSDQYINVVSREDGSGTRAAFIELFGIEIKSDVGKSAKGLRRDRTTDEAMIVNKTGIMLSSISEDLYSIGYISLGSLNDTVKALKIDGAKGTAENIKNGSYKIFRPFNIAVNSEISEVTKDFINFIMSKEGQDVVSNYYISIDENLPNYDSQKPRGKIVISGSSSVAPLMEKLQEAYEKINPNAIIEIQMSDSTTGMANTIEGTCDIGMASRDLKDSEKESLTAIEIALDGILVVVNKNNPFDELTSENIYQIFTGEAERWNEIN